MSDENEIDPEVEAKRRKTADLLYDAMNTTVAMLAQRVDETAARNYVGITFDGVNTGPFDRIELTFIRHGGLTPTAKVSVLKDRIRAIRPRLNRLVVDVCDQQEVVDELREVMRTITEIADS